MQPGMEADAGRPNDRRDGGGIAVNQQDELDLDGMHREVLVAGGGQAGPSIRYCPDQAGGGHLVLEKSTVGNEWRERRWDSFCLVTPNWQCLLPGFPYPGPVQHGFMLRDEIADYVEAY